MMIPRVSQKCPKMSHFGQKCPKSVQLWPEVSQKCREEKFLSYFSDAYVCGLGHIMDSVGCGDSNKARDSLAQKQEKSPGDATALFLETLFLETKEFPYFIIIFGPVFLNFESEEISEGNRARFVEEVRTDFPGLI